MSDSTNNTNLQENNTNDNLQIEPNNDTSLNSAGQMDSPEDTQNGYASYERVIKSQNATIETLTGQIESLNKQISALVRSSGTSSDNGTYNPAIDPDTNSAPIIPDDYVYLKELGKEIGKRN